MTSQTNILHMIGHLTISTTGYLINDYTWRSSFLSSFCFIITSLRHFIKAAEYIWDTMMGISSLSFAALMKLDLTYSEKVLSATFALISFCSMCPLNFTGDKILIRFWHNI